MKVLPGKTGNDGEMTVGNPRKQARKMSAIRRVGVIGMGLMGNGIVQVTAANAKVAVVALDSSSDSVSRGITAIRKSLTLIATKSVSKGLKTKEVAEGEVESALSLISGTTDKAALKECDLVIEAAPEDWQLKKALYNGLHANLSPTAILASNTSGLLIGDLAREFGDPSRVLGLHYFNPVALMQLVEVVVTPTVAPQHVEACMALVKAQGKTPIQCADAPGFIVNRLLVPFMASAIALYDRKEAKIGDIDTAMKLGTGHPMGPLHLCDYVGLDTMLYILQNWKKQYPNEPSFFIPEGLKRRVEAGLLGRKSGKGFYVWEGDKVIKPVE